jgi:acyl-CoA thioesterase FadM
VSRPQPIPRSALPGAAFSSAYRIRFDDCDPAGIVFFGAWFGIAHGAVEDFLDHIGVPFAQLNGQRRVGTGMAHASADWFRPGLMGDRITLTPLVARIGGGSYALTVHAHRAQDELARLHLVTATTDLSTHRPIRIPDELRAALATYQARCA